MTGVGAIASSYASATGWTPADLPNLHTWYDAADASTFSYSSGTIVSQWRDKSGNGYHLDTGGGPDRAGTINGRTTVVFDGTNDYLGTGISTFSLLTIPITYLIVARNTASSGQRDLFISNGDGRIFRTSTGTIDLYGGSFLSSGLAWGTTDARSVVGVFNSTSSKIAVDSGSYTGGNAGSAPGGSGATAWTAGAYSDGASEFWQGDICEIVVVTGEISAPNLAEWWDYCSTKWGTP